MSSSTSPVAALARSQNVRTGVHPGISGSVAETQLGDDLGIQPEQERIDEGRVGGEGDDGVVRKRTGARQQPFRIVVT